MPTTLADRLLREVPLLRTAQTVGDAAREVVRSERPALPVVDARGAYAGVFGEREFMGAFFPGYFGELHGAGFVPRTLDEALERRAAALEEPVERHLNSERVALGEDYSDAGLAERFLHHRVLIVPVLDRERHVTGIVARGDFFRALVERAAAR